MEGEGGARVEGRGTGAVVEGTGSGADAEGAGARAGVEDTGGGIIVGSVDGDVAWLFSLSEVCFCVSPLLNMFPIR